MNDTWTFQIASNVPRAAEIWPRKKLDELNSRPFFDHPEESVITDLVRELDAGDVFYDVGAFVGFYSKWVSELVGAEVISFEPSPDSYHTLRNRSEEFSGPITVLPIALGAETGTATLSSPPPDAEGVPALSECTTDGFDVNVLDGDRLIGTYGFPEPTVMKIDVEGAELGVLTGFSDVLEDGGCNLIYVEVHRPDTDLQSTIANFDATPGQLHEYLNKKGYSLAQIGEFGDHYHLKAYR